MNQLTPVLEAALLVSGYRAAVDLSNITRLSDVDKRSHRWDDVRSLKHLCRHIRAQIDAACPTAEWDDRYSWYLITDLLSDVDDSQVQSSEDLVVAKHMLACGGPYADSFVVPVKTISGQPITLRTIRAQRPKSGGKAGIYAEDMELRRLMCARILGLNSNVFRRTEGHPATAAKALLDKIKTAITTPNYIAERIDGYRQRLMAEERTAQATNGDQPSDEPGSSADAEPSTLPRRTLRSVLLPVSRHPTKTAVAVIAIAAVASSLTAVFFWRSSPKVDVVGGSGAPSSSSAAQSGTPPTSTTPPVPSPATFRASPSHICENPNPPTQDDIRPYICVIAWCEGGILNLDGTENRENIFVKIRPGIFNKSPDPLDLSITGVSALRLLVRESNMPDSWKPPPMTAAANDRPIQVEWKGILFWAVAPNLPTEYIPEVISVEDGLLHYVRFATFWDAAAIPGGGSYYRTVKQLSPDPYDVVQEADLVFEIPRQSDIYGIAIVKRSSPTHVLSVAEAGENAKLWPPSRVPATF